MLATYEVRPRNGRALECGLNPRARAEITYLDELGRAGGRTRLDRLVAAGHQVDLYGQEQLLVKQPNHRTQEFVPSEPPTSRPQEVTTASVTSALR